VEDKKHVYGIRVHMLFVFFVFFVFVGGCCDLEVISVSFGRGRSFAQNRRIHASIPRDKKS